MGKTDIHIDLTREDKGPVYHGVIEDIDETMIEALYLGVWHLVEQTKAVMKLAKQED